MSENQKNTEIAQEAALDEMFAAARKPVCPLRQNAAVGRA